MDPTWAQLLTLDHGFRDVVLQFINELRSVHKLPAVIQPGGALRSSSEQTRLVAAGRSRTQTSRHLAGRAVDIDFYGLGRNAVPSWVWAEVGPIGESYGLTWGGRWKNFPDVGHFED